MTPFRSRAAIILGVLVVAMFGVPQVADGLTMDVPGENTRVVGNETTIRTTPIPGPTDHRRTRVDTGPSGEPLFDETNVDAHGSVYHVDLSGNEARSFKTEGTNGQIDLDFEGLNRWGSGHELYLSTQLRGSDDPQVLPDNRVAIQGLYGEFRREGDYRLRFGNVSASFSDYSLSSSADVGIHYELKARTDTGWKWEAYLARPNRSTASQYRRHNAGLRVSAETGGGILRRYGFNGVVTEDDESSASSGSPAVDNRVVSADGRLAVSPDFLVDGELAYARTDTDVTAAGLDTIDDWALKLDGVYRLVDTGSFRRGRLNVYYEEVQPDFRSTSGGGSPDQRRGRGRLSGTYYPTEGGPGIDVELLTERSADNLDHQLARETESKTHQFRAGMSPYESRELGEGQWGTFRENLRLVTEFRFYDVETSDTLFDRETWSENYRAESRVGAHDVSGFYEARDYDNLSPGAVDRRRRQYGVEYSYRKFRGIDLGGGPIPADLRLDVTRTEDWQIQGTGGSDRLRWHAGSTLYLAGQYRLTVDWREEDTDNNGSNNNFTRTNWDLRLRGHELFGGRGRLNLSYRVNDVDEQNNSNSYREETLRADIEFPF